MQTLLIVLQVIVGLGILNVWFVRRDRQTPFRGGHTTSISEEFKYYGMPSWSVPVVGFFKVSFALLILAGFFNPSFVALGASGLAFFMMGAVLMHIKVKDSIVQAAPAFLMLVMCGLLAWGSSPNIMTIAGNL